MFQASSCTRPWRTAKALRFQDSARMTFRSMRTACRNGLNILVTMIFPSRWAWFWTTAEAWDPNAMRSLPRPWRLRAPAIRRTRCSWSISMSMFRLAFPPTRPLRTRRRNCRWHCRNSRPTGETALYDALAAAHRAPEAGQSGQESVLIVVSDGGDNASKYNLSQILAMAGKSDAIIYTIGIHTDEDPDKKPGALRAARQGYRRRSSFPGSLPDVVPSANASPMIFVNSTRSLIPP